MGVMTDYITTHEAAKIIGVSHSQVTRYCTSGDLPSTRMGRMGSREIQIKLRDAKKFRRPRRGNPNHLGLKP